MMDRKITTTTTSHWGIVNVDVVDDRIVCLPFPETPTLRKSPNC